MLNRPLSTSKPRTVVVPVVLFVGMPADLFAVTLLAVLTIFQVCASLGTTLPVFEFGICCTETADQVDELSQLPSLTDRYGNGIGAVSSCQPIIAFNLP